MRIFSLPLNPKLNQRQFERYCAFLDSYGEWIYDIYFTSRISPFDQDAMGDVFVDPPEAAAAAIDTALWLQQRFGITVSATFNNIHVVPDQRNLDLFIKNFKPLYDAGVRSATIPHTQWMRTGQIKAEFPELWIKNTILREVNRANQVVELAAAGFDYVNLDRDLMRDRDELDKIARVKQLYPNLKISLLANEGCIGNCPIMPEHYHYNCARTAADPQYFNSSIARISCQHWDVTDPAVQLKTANLPPWREDWEELRSLGIDTFKMHGRENPNRLGESLGIIAAYADGQPILFDSFSDYLADNNLSDRPIDAWRKIIKNCKFDCWDCGFCDRVYAARGGQQPDDLVLKVADVVANHPLSDLPRTDIPGLTSHRMRQLLCELGKLSQHYLEIGCYLGATATAVLAANPARATFVDHWQQQIQPAGQGQLPENSKAQFMANVRAHKLDTAAQLYDSDWQRVDTALIGGVDLWFYDGPHDALSTAAAVKSFAGCLAARAVLVFDDANWEGVVDGARQGMAEAGLTLLYDKLILNDQEDPDQWWNGAYITVVKRS